MRNRWLRTAAAAAALVCGSCGAPAAPPTDDAGGLIVLVVIDQLPQYLLERYDSLFSGGFRRLLDEGLVYTQAFQEHSRTSTAPGHATIATGLFPYRHGIVGNAWRERVNGEWIDVENFSDSTERIVGRESRGFSPRKLDASTLADWLKAADSESRVFAVSGKVRSAVPLAGSGDGHVYIFDDGYGSAFVTSTYYRTEVPDWVRRFSGGRLAELLADSVWESHVRPEYVWASLPDTIPYERGGRYVHFPHDFRLERAAWGGGHEDYLDWFSHTPGSDRAAIELAIEAVGALELGQRESVDLIGLGLSATDRIGHMYGPYSREQLDNLLKLDRALGEFFASLDASVGRDHYWAALSADHGVMHAPEYLQEIGRDAGRLAPARVLEMIGAIDTISASSDEELRARRAEVLEAFDIVAEVFTDEELGRVDPRRDPATAPDSFAILFRRSFRPDRAIGLGDRGVHVRVREGWVTGTSTATHGSPYAHDRHVPLIFMGPGVEPGRREERVVTADLAPTMARLADIPVQGTTDGRSLIDR